LAQKIVDTHVHFWQPDGDLNYDWLKGTPLDRPFLPADLHEQAGDLKIEKIVFLECGCPPEQGVKEIEWVHSLNEPKIGGMVATAPLERGDEARPYLEKLAAFPLVKGIRRLIQSEPLGFSVQSDFVSAVQSLPEYGFSFDICIVHPQLDDVLNLVEQCPDVSFVLDHIGKPDIKAGLLDPWREKITKLADFPNVECKISGMVTEADHDNWTRDDLKPYIDHVIESFGIDRVMYGGDWGVSTLATTYTDWVETLNWATQTLSQADKDKLFYENGMRFYRIEQ